MAVPAEATSAGRRRKPLRPRRRALRPDRHVRRPGDGDRLRRGGAARAGGARRVLDVNFLGRAHAYRAALPHLKASRGTFIDVNSGLAYRGIPLQAAYCASKAAARAYFESARVELAKHGPASTSACPPRRDQHPAVRPRPAEARLRPQPVPPIYQPEIVAAAILRCAERPERELPVTWGAQKLLWGQKLSPRPATSSCSGTAGRDSPPASRSRSTSPTTSGRRSRAIRARTGASTPREGFERVDERSPAPRQDRVDGCLSALSALAGAIGYHGITKRRASPL